MVIVTVVAPGLELLLFFKKNFKIYVHKMALRGKKIITNSRNMGYSRVKISDVIALNALNVTPKYISNMREKGFNYTILTSTFSLKL